MTEITGTQATIEVVGNDAGLVSLNQKSESGEKQTVVLDLHQAEHLANWLTQYVRMAREGVSEE